MATVLNRTTKELLQSANTVDYPVVDWIINPDLSAISGFPAKYWLITGDGVSLMNQAQRNTVDATSLALNRSATAGDLDQVEDLSRAFALVCLDELNAHANKINSILSAIDGATTLAAMKTAIAAIPDYPQRTIANLKTSVLSKLGT